MYTVYYLQPPIYISDVVLVAIALYSQGFIQSVCSHLYMCIAPRAAFASRSAALTLLHDLLSVFLAGRVHVHSVISHLTVDFKLTDIDATSRSIQTRRPTRLDLLNIMTVYPTHL